MTVVTRQVVASADDCSFIIAYFYGETWETVNLTDPMQIAGRDYQSEEWYIYKGGMRFLNITIPQGATILSAYLKLKASYSMAITTVNTRFEGQDSDDTVTFINDPDEYQARPRTSAKVDCLNIGAWVAGTWYSSNDLKTIIQQIVNRGGWASGNSMVLFWNELYSSAKLGANRIGYSYNGSASDAPTLEITYEEPVTAKRLQMNGLIMIQQ